MFKFYLSSVLVLLLAGVSFGATCIWNNNSEDGLWSTVGNWDGGSPTINDSVHIGSWGNTTIGPIIDSTVVAKGFWIAVSMDAGPGPIILTMTGGSLDATYFSLGYSTIAEGVMNISGGQVNIGNSFVVGGTGDKGAVSGTLNMSGGVMTIGSYFNIGNGAGGAGTVNLSGGTINSPDIWMRDSTDAHPKLNLAGGKVVLPIGMKSRVETYIANDWIVAFNDPNQVVAIESIDDSAIQIVGYPKTCDDAWTLGLGLNSDLNQDCVVDFKDLADFVLDWLRCNDPEISGCESY